MHTHTHTHTCNSCKTLIGVHEMHGRMHPNWGLATILLAHDPLSSLAYPRIIHTPLAVGNLPIKTLVARQQPTNKHTHTHTQWHTLASNLFATEKVQSPVLKQSPSFIVWPERDIISTEIWVHNLWLVATGAGECLAFSEGLWSVLKPLGSYDRTTAG